MPSSFFSGPWSRATENLFQPRAIVPFFLGTVAFTFLTDVLLQLALGTTDASSERLAIVLITSLIVLIATVAWLRWSLMRLPAVGNVLSNKKQPHPHKGLVFMIGRGGPDTCETTFVFHEDALKHLWLICSSETESATTSLINKLQANHPDVTFHPPLIINDVNDPNEFYRIIKGIYRHCPAGLKQSDIICDYVGMTAHASVGMSLVCRKYGWPLEYTPAKYNADLRPVGALAPILILKARNMESETLADSEQPSTSTESPAS